MVEERNYNKSLKFVTAVKNLIFTGLANARRLAGR